MPDQTTNQPETFTAPDGAEVQPLTDLLATFRRGTFNRDISLAFHELVGDVSRVEKGGSLTIKVTVKPAGADHLEVDMVADHSVKSPTPDAPSARYFIGKQGNLTRHDPNSLPFPDDNQEP